MKNYTTPSSDSTPISVNLSGKGDTALLFVHGWLGNKSWWDKQVSAFESSYVVASMDLAGHGDSGKGRKEYTAKLYADDIVAVAKSLQVKNIILVGHSMSGPYSLEAAPLIPNLKGIVAVDTLKDFEQGFTTEQIESMLNLYSTNFGMVVENMLPAYLYAEGTPPEVKARLDNEFLSQASFAREAIEPFYWMDVKKIAPLVKVPVRAINSDKGPTNKENNSKYLSDYNVKLIEGIGHYPMLEAPEKFNFALKEILIELTPSRNEG